jgi:hypothetical protein
MTEPDRRPVLYTPDVESHDDDEPKTVADLDRTMGEIRETTFRHTGHATRSVHVKSHGALRATLTVEPGLPPAHAQGLFAAPGRYEALLRFSSPPGDRLDDTVSLTRALALKIVGVPGERLEGSEGDTTQNFVFIDTPVFSAPSAKGFLRNLKLLAATTDKAEGAKKALSATLQAAEKVVELFGAKSATLTAMGGHARTQVLGETYFTAAPHRFGAHVAKLALAPVSPELRALTDAPADLDGRPDGLREDLVAFMRTHRAEWALRAQLCTDLEAMPIEDPSVEWDAEASPYVTVARLVAEPQEAWNDAIAAYVDDRLFFSPWRGLAAHRPLGDVMRARKPAYEHSARFRAEKNGVPVEEPADLAAYPA